MIEILNGIRETVTFKSETHLRFYDNVDVEDYPSHWHTPLEIIMPLENSYQVVCNKISYDLQVGDILIIAPGTLHNMEAQSGHRLIFQADFSLLYGIKELAATMTLIYPAIHINPALDEKCHRKIHDLMLSVADEYSSSQLLHEAAIYAKLLEVLVEAARHCRAFSNREDDGTKRREYVERFLKICDYINEHFNENLSLDDVASLSGFSKYHFSRLFKQFTQVSFYRYLNQKRIEHATRLLLDNDLSVTEVAIQCGYGSLSSFIRMFKIICDCTPGEFKAMYLAN